MERFQIPQDVVSRVQKPVCAFVSQPAIFSNGPSFSPLPPSRPRPQVRGPRLEARPSRGMGTTSRIQPPALPLGGEREGNMSAVLGVRRAS